MKKASAGLAGFALFPWLLRLQGFNVRSQVVNALLHLTLMTLAHSHKHGTPNRHLGRTMSWAVRVAADNRSHMVGWIGAAVLLAQLSEVGKRSLHR